MSLFLACTSTEPDTQNSETATTDEVQEPTDDSATEVDAQPVITMDESEVSSDDPSLESAIKKIRTQFQETESANASLTQKSLRDYEFEDFEITAITGYYDKEENIRKITMEKAIGHSGSLTAYYIKDDVPYFVFEQAAHEASLRGPYTYEERRIYMNNGKIIRQLEKEKTVEGEADPEMSKVPNKDVTEALEDTSDQEYVDLVKQLMEVLSKDSDTTENAQ